MNLLKIIIHDSVTTYYTHIRTALLYILVHIQIKTKKLLSCYLRIIHSVTDASNSDVNPTCYNRPRCVDEFKDPIKILLLVETGVFLFLEEIIARIRL